MASGNPPMFTGFDDSDDEYYATYLAKDQKVICALGIYAHGASADQLDELICMGESTVLEALKYFCENVIRLLGPEYLRKPTPDDLETLIAENAARCWKNCLTAWQGAFKGKEKTSTVILKAVASKSLWIWHAFYGMPGANNDLNVLERSPLMNDSVNGEAPQSSISVPQDSKRKRYAAVQEAVRKDIERGFGVLQQRFRIVALPCKLWKVDAMNDGMLACIILHNMVVEDELMLTSLNHDYLFEDNWVSPARTVAANESPIATIANALGVIEDEGLHYKLKK
ncbi:hypothetical protein PHMEG_00012797 [Phytophthora megakarya]|uniref:DDE Tnp4 domain-containing protein n=1 Tax=Phytophthora megakarya TaxID=4795 RepID=A0A225W9D3_9STRA|nr:hypothetical protein PHMEG_00012797 [Phytophthora megakarya]